MSYYKDLTVRLMGSLGFHLKQLDVTSGDRYSGSSLDRNIFSYWDSADRTKISDFIDDWSKASSIFRVFGIDDVRPLVKKYFSEYADVFNAIQIPSARSDVARLILLYEFGGLYVDCHFGVRADADLPRLLSLLTENEAVFVDRRLSLGTRPPGEYFLINGAMLLKRRSKISLNLAGHALANLECLRECERTSGHIPYHLGYLTGAGLLMSTVMRPCTNYRELKPEYSKRVLIVAEETAQIERNRHRTYGGPGAHWSERQQKELLFAQ